jgi:heme exporter protein C
MANSNGSAPWYEQPSLGQTARWVVGLGIIGTTIWGMQVGPASSFKEPDLARILFWHLPFAFLTVLFLVIGAVFSFKTLKAEGAAEPDMKAEAANELAMVFGLITMATGILFSKAQWGAWWSWDPRQTSFLFVLLILSAYFAIRSAFSDPAKRAANSAAYCLAALLPILFLVFVLPRVISLHPSNTIAGGGLKGDYWRVVLTNFALFLFIGGWLYKMKVKTSILELQLETQDGELDAGGSRAATGVVRPLSVPDEGG